MRITLDLDPADLQRFDAALARVRRASACADEIDVIEAAKHALDQLCATATPGFVRKRLVEVQRLILMLEDEGWALTGRERDDVLAVLVYFSDPDDLVPDHVEVLGLLDDAIMLELLLRRLRHVLSAYAAFCEARSRLGQAAPDEGARVQHAVELARHRAELQARMRRQRQRAGAS